ncbi:MULTISPECIES: N-acetylmuramate alpha-1-phosphate uridylyltransferase MurU [Cupriavidus]|uniref:Sugar-phosphate nucleotidyl transferase n=1 Tax=Cupriavidus taiwanensis TaxID=164546 RepID=A0A375EZK7_9BURK|nr:MULTISPECIES: nucleotidyltransferase family protein [Cupriavidus]MEC3765842.1 nucleotidyltransferase family protein [Cupriavidus sp. SS-3]SOY86517.1 putative sugar-phosphate nucleotidyl transferase [Cupriavidus taiwanensis]SOY89805.1 putative sugar-phosphate nucleotidyl transferase [Cupriavidus taiwanensis]SPA28890.1 putative sugar-phosphate nucleotidyl transferase [Cupriavidus taiwanensis]SPA48095.1 putative sugar-phosphate nucleotidyl transferase [Cupriavidus taiwanensis]
MKVMIFAAGRGDRMRPLTDACPKPLLAVGGKPLIVWKIEALARAGLRDIVINHAWLGAQIEAALGDGSRFGVRIAYSAEGEALETAGGIAKALPLLSHDPVRGEIFLAVSGDIFCDYDFRALLPRAQALAGAAAPHMHLVMVPNPPFHPRGDFALDDHGRLSLEAEPATGARLTFGNIGLYDTRLFTDIVPGTRLAMTPIYHAGIAAGTATGERFDGRWENVGTPAQLTELDAMLSAAPGR